MGNPGRKVQPKKLIYRISSSEDVINHFSTENCELLSDSFRSYIELMLPDIPDDAPILLEITGAKISDDEKVSIDKAIWVHYRMIMAGITRDLKECRTKTLWFLICTILSSAFLYMAANITSELVTQYFYLPIWFFGYRLLIFPLQEYFPLKKKLELYRRLAALKLIFSEEPVRNISDAMADEVLQENIRYYNEAGDKERNEELIRRFTRDDGTTALKCNISSAQELLHPCSDTGSEMISEEFEAFLEQAALIVNPDKPAELTIDGAEITDEEKSCIRCAISSYFHLKYCRAEEILHEGRRRILIYTLGLIAASIVLFLAGKSVGIALHEFMLISLWFFGDFLVEFVLLGQRDAKYNVRLCRRLMDMMIHFE